MPHLPKGILSLHGEFVLVSVAFKRTLGVYGSTDDNARFLIDTLYYVHSKLATIKKLTPS